MFFDLTYPLIQAPMAGSTTPELVASVSNAGGLGSLGAAYLTPDDLRQQIRAIKVLTNKPFAVNLFVKETVNNTTQEKQMIMCRILNDICSELSVDVRPVDPPYCPDFDEQLAVLLEEDVPIFSFTFGIPDQHCLKQLKQRSVPLIGTATCLEEAQALEKAGVDAIVAQGIEAGGHRGTFAGHSESIHDRNSLMSQMIDVINLPIIAAGGIGDAGGVSAALEGGAAAVQIGTLFLTTKESGAHLAHKKVLLSLTEDNTQLTRAFSGRWARSVNNVFIQRMHEHEGVILPFPIQNKVTKQIRTIAEKQNNTEFMSLWAGQSAYCCHDIAAGDLVEELVE